MCLQTSQGRKLREVQGMLCAQVLHCSSPWVCSAVEVLDTGLQLTEGGEISMQTGRGLPTLAAFAQIASPFPFTCIPCYNLTLSRNMEPHI